MKKLFLLSLLTIFSACTSAQTKNKTAVLELFTSEGCSSCPPAEALVQKLQAEDPGLIVLSYHVDYWDRLGWKDPFSKPEWTRQQNEYATALRTDNVYTPQAVVNGQGHITGSNRAGIAELLNKYPLPPNEPAIQLSSTFSEGIVLVSYEVPLAPGQVLQVNLVKKQATTAVERGENSGKTLLHANVVLEQKTLRGIRGKVSFALPAGSTASDFSLIAFVQEVGTMQVSSAVEKGL